MRAKKLNTLSLLVIFILSITIQGCGGSGAGPIEVPPGVSPGIPSLLKLDASTYVAHTDAYVVISAKVFDGNGMPVASVPVTFTNLSNIGTFKTSQLNTPLLSNSLAQTVTTDSNGIAKVTLTSSSPGWITILASISGDNQLRDRKLIYFSSKDVLETLTPTISLEVLCVLITNDTCTGNPYILFENDRDNRVLIKAKVKNRYGDVITSRKVNWSSSHEEATFERKDIQTNIYGEATAIVKVDTSVLRSVDTFVNIMVDALVENENYRATGMVSLLLRPVVVDETKSAVTAINTSVQQGATTQVHADIRSSAGQPVPDNTPVDFSTTCGSLNPLSAATTNGRATTTFTAPQIAPAGGSCTVTAKVAGKTIGNVNIQITNALAVQPSTMTLSETQTVTFTIFGGIPPYTVASRHSEVNVDPTTVNTAGGTFTVTPTDNFCTPSQGAQTCQGNTAIEVRDSVGASVIVNLTINGN